MPVRTTPEAVQDILAPGGDYTPGKDLRPFIAVANNIVNWIQAHAVDYDRDPNDDETALQLESWLAAWAYKCSDQQLASSTAGRSTASFRGQSGKGFELNNYGQVAMQIDGTGLLGAFNRGAIIGAAWLGKLVVDQLSWRQRNIQGV